MAKFRNRDAREYITTAKYFVRSYYRDAECGSYWCDKDDPRKMTYVVKSLPLIWKRVHGYEGDTLGEGSTPQKARMDAARKLEARLRAGGYQ